MTPLYIIFFVSVIIFIIILLVLQFTGNFETYEIPSPDIEKFKDVYTIINPWSDSQPTKTDGGYCNIYTKISEENFNLGKISYNDECMKNGKCPYTKATSNFCLDEDQFLASEREHTCLYPNINQKWCLQQNGDLVESTKIETYFQKCNPKGKAGDESAKCLGSLNLIAFNLNSNGKGVQIFENGVCMSSPIYTKNETSKGIIYENMSPVLQAPCNTTEIYNESPTQLFRVINAKYDGNNFKVDPKGPYSRIEHRPSNYVLSPIENKTNSYLTFIPPKDSQFGYFWVMVPEIIQENQKLKKSVSQLVFIDDPKSVPDPIDKVKFWDYITKKKSIKIETNQKGPEKIGKLRLGPFLTYNSLNKNEETNAMYSKTDYVKYSTIKNFMS